MRKLTVYTNVMRWDLNKQTHLEIAYDISYSIAKPPQECLLRISKFGSVVKNEMIQD